MNERLKILFIFVDGFGLGSDDPAVNPLMWREFPNFGKNDVLAPRSAVPQRSCLAVGPEGGWTPYELDMFTSHGFEVFGMGPRILRTDTACIGLCRLLAEMLRKGV